MEVVPARSEYESLIGSNRKDNIPFNEMDLVSYHHLSPVEQQSLATLTSLITVLVGYVDLELLTLS